MVRLFLAPAKGNAGGRYFPFQGYLGLTPLRVDGIVRTKLEEDGKPVLAKSLSVHVRCYESRVGRTGSHRSHILVDYAKTLWQKSDHEEYGLLGDFDGTFKISLPANVPGYSTANYQEYKFFWRVEAVLEHVHINYVGSRLLRYYDLPLIRYDVPPPPPPNPSPTARPTSSSTPLTLYVPNSKPPTPIISYNLSTPVLPVGPSDLILSSLFLRPLDPSVSIRSASVLVERRIDLYHISNTSYFASATDVAPASPDENEDPVHTASSPSSSSAVATTLLPPRGFFGSASSPSSASTTPPPIALSSSMPESSSAAAARARSPYSYSPTHSGSTLGLPGASASSYSVSSSSPLLPPPPPPPLPTTPSAALNELPSRSVATTVIHGDSGGTGGFAVDRATGVWSKTVNLTWPKARSQNLWAMGETARTESAEVTFWVKVKVVVSSPSLGTFSLDLEPRELTVVSTNDSDRRLALAKFAEQKDERSKSKSKSPRRRRARESDGEGERERERDREKGRRQTQSDGGGGGRGSPTDPSGSGSGAKAHRHHRPVPPPIPTLPSLPLASPHAHAHPKSPPMPIHIPPYSPTTTTTTTTTKLT
ncbi:hypothetical protein EIP91_011573, partial [Steccherinum ochraceum]